MILPYPFQRCVADLLLSGQNVILQAPTGAGKTYAALLPFIEARERRLDFPRRCIYSVPMRVLANQFAASQLGHEHDARIQTGEHAEDREFSSDLTFATIDQVLSSFLMTPYSLSRRQANLNAGAIASSYLVFDEFHLFDATIMLPTTLEMLRILRGVTPFLLMTATFSREMLSALADYLHAVIVPETPEDAAQLQSLPSQQKIRRYHVASRPLDAEAVLATHKARSLVICNTVERAQRLFLQLKEASACSDEVILLHARFLPADRARIEERLRSTFGQDAPSDTRCIAVATQAIEVGLDITCEALHTELAPANAVLQRAGRCARYKGETGDVYIYPSSAADPSEPVDLIEKVAPYVSQRAEIEATLAEFQVRDGQVFNFLDEQELITAVHAARDRDTIIGLKATQGAQRSKMNACWRGEYVGSAELIRNIASQKVIVHDDPLAVAAKPFAYDSFALHFGVVAGLVKDWLERIETGEMDEAGVWGLHDITSGEGEQPCWDALPMKSPKETQGALAIIVHPALARYDAALGFWPYEGGDFVAQATPSAQPTRELYAYHLEPYAEHARLVWQAHCEMWPSLALAAHRLEIRAAWPVGILDRLAELTALLHDVGKLNVPWQEWVRKYQRIIGRPVSQGYYAHTDSNPNDPAHDRAARAAGKRSAHAMEGAVATAPWLARLASHDIHLIRPAFSAIARHHGAFTSSFASYQLAKGSRDLIRETLTHAGIVAPQDQDWLCARADLVESQEEVDSLFVNPDQDDELVAYMLLARALRRADQAGTSANSGSQTHKEGTM